MPSGCAHYALMGGTYGCIKHQLNPGLLNSWVLSSLEVYQSGVLCPPVAALFSGWWEVSEPGHVEWLTDLGMFRIGGRELRKTTIPARWKQGFGFSGFILWGRTNYFSGGKLQQISTPYGRLL